MNTGFIYLHRKIKKHWVWKKPEYFQWFIHILFRANFKDNKVLIGSELYELKRGQFITSIQKLTFELNNCTTQKIRTFLKLLEKDEIINIATTSKLTIITICKYDSYQTSQQTNNKQITNEQQTNNKPVTIENNVNKENKEKDIYYTLENFDLSVTEKEYNKLLQNYNKEQIQDIFNAIDNNKKSKNYTSLYKASLNWLKRNNIKDQKFNKHKEIYRNEYKQNGKEQNHILKDYRQIIKIIVDKKDALKKTPLKYKEFIELYNYAIAQDVNLKRDIKDIIASDEVAFKLDLDTGIRNYIKNNSKSL